MTTTSVNERAGSQRAILYSVLLLTFAYALLGLSLTERPDHMDLMSRCVLMSPNLSRIWSVANVEVGLAYFGVFFGMLYYVVATREARSQHLRDLLLAVAYVIGSFIIDLICVMHFQPFTALLIGDAAVMTFTLIVSRRLWFQRLLGVFVPLIFLTCGFGHLLEGMSFWKLTYPVNVPWSMVTADIGFAVLVNSSRFPGFIRGQDIQEEMFALQLAQRKQNAFLQSVLFAVTEGRLIYHTVADDLPAQLSRVGETLRLTRETLREGRARAEDVAHRLGFPADRIDALTTAAGEAMMNAIVHATEADLWICGNDREIQLWIQDKGTGIALDDLPKAALMKGWSTRGTLGMGFSLMLSCADAVDLATGEDGTTVVITVRRYPVAAIFPSLS
ncbi:MAG TPA: ATP-binding protein [Capsulimonadaceae bacterium]|jgi:anti-sigma regulatory factor (Ser/Thr protein kinase)